MVSMFTVSSTIIGGRTSNKTGVHTQEMNGKKVLLITDSFVPATEEVGEHCHKAWQQVTCLTHLSQTKAGGRGR